VSQATVSECDTSNLLQKIIFIQTNEIVEVCTDPTEQQIAEEVTATAAVMEETVETDDFGTTPLVMSASPVALVQSIKQEKAGKILDA